MKINTRSNTPIYEQIANGIINDIQSGLYQSGDSLPSVRALAVEMGINPNTVARAFKLLEEKEIIYTIVGKGAFVGDNYQEAINEFSSDSVKKVLVSALRSGYKKDTIIKLVNEIWGENND